ncbi:type IV pilus twitching motility protein PilT [Actinotalea fermentans]|uniref:Bacterial type II secretion system protein E domain-containing protein n=1 Tax=Actinotalea fermentans TaxID=43671 RepID=A0A511YUH5_9CELL|nr:type IV pilus twitching motility protein PilT [Actinotalea fermentans]GEN78847.1 hypothetical protein AFE02nite_05810 [Actinotalea fermentans]
MSDYPPVPGAVPDQPRAGGPAGWLPSGPAPSAAQHAAPGWPAAAASPGEPTPIPQGRPITPPQAPRVAPPAQYGQPAPQYGQPPVPATPYGQPAAPAYQQPVAPPAAPAATTLPGAPASYQPAAPAYPQPPAAPAPARPAAPPAAEAPQAARKPAAAASTRRLGMGDGPGENDLNLDETLRAMIAVGASDLHITSGAPPTVRIDGRLLPLEGHPSLMPDQIQRTLYSVLTQRQREQFETDLELDFAYAVRGVARFRVNLYQQRDALGAAFRVIPYEIKPLEALGVPPVVGNFANLPRGLVLVTGPTGSGKSTTLASIIDLANRTRTDHIMTVEDPIEFLHRHKKSLINQREVGADTLSFANALKHVLRQDPDIILVGEMRDLETISVALTAAETGHLVFATLHTQDAAQTIDRIIDVFPSHQQAQVRTQLAGAIQGVVCQALCKRADGPGRAVATEVMIATPAIRNLIREGKTHQIYSAMQAGAKQGMHTMDQHLAELVKAGRITYEQGLEKCHHVADYNRLTGRTGSGGGGGSSLGAMSGGLGDPMSMGSSGGQMPGASETYGGQG